MKIFDDLVFKSHPNKNCGFNTQAEINFDNGFGVSVITGDSAYSSEGAPYEVAVLYDGEITYSTPITNNVLGYQTAEEVTDIMKQVQELT